MERHTFQANPWKVRAEWIMLPKPTCKFPYNAQIQSKTEQILELVYKWAPQRPHWGNNIELKLNKNLFSPLGETISIRHDNLDLEASAVPPSSCLLKLPSLGADIRLGVAVRHTRRWAKVLHGFPSILRSPQQNLRIAANCEIILSAETWQNAIAL